MYTRHRNQYNAGKVFNEIGRENLRIEENYNSGCISKFVLFDGILVEYDFFQTFFSIKLIL
jgi:hypothetical protein